MNDPQHPALELLARKKPLIIAHRGCCAHGPENTLAAIELGLNAGADLIELDYCHTKDGVPVVLHDDTLDRTTNARQLWKRRGCRVADCSLAELQELDAGTWFHPRFAGTRIPLLTEALDLIRAVGKVALIEHKGGDPETCIQILRERNLINHVVVISFDWQYLRRFHELEPRQILGALGPPKHLADGRKPAGWSRRLLPARLEDASKTGAQLIVWNRDVTARSIAAAHQRGWNVWIYTIDEAREARQLIALGVTGIITNDPARIREAVLDHGPSRQV